MNDDYCNKLFESLQVGVTANKKPVDPYCKF